MRLGNRLEQVRQAATQYLGALPINSYIGLVAFHGYAQRLAPLTLIEDRDSWEVLKQRLLRQEMRRWTSIGGALKEALRILKHSGPSDLRDSGIFTTSGALE